MDLQRHLDVVHNMSSVCLLMRHGVDNVKHRPVGNPKRKV
jgi:hypothetical protein